MLIFSHIVLACNPHAYIFVINIKTEIKKSTSAGMLSKISLLGFYILNSAYHSIIDRVDMSSMNCLLFFSPSLILIVVHPLVNSIFDRNSMRHHRIEQATELFEWNTSRRRFYSQNLIQAHALRVSDFRHNTYEHSQLWKGKGTHWLFLSENGSRHAKCHHKNWIALYTRPTWEFAKPVCMRFKDLENAVTETCFGFFSLYGTKPMLPPWNAPQWMNVWMMDGQTANYSTTWASVGATTFTTAVCTARQYCESESSPPLNRHHWKRLKKYFEENLFWGIDQIITPALLSQY